MAKKGVKIREIGFKPMPLFLKILFVFSVFQIASIIQNIFLGSGQFIFVFFVSGILGSVVLALSLILVVVLAVALWKRYSWAWKYGVALYAFYTLNSILFLFNMGQLIRQSLAASGIMTPEVYSFSYAVASVGMAIGIVVNIIFLLLIYKNRAYFK